MAEGSKKANKKHLAKTTTEKIKEKTLSAELQNVFNLKEVKAEVHWWRTLDDCIRGNSVGSVKSSHFNNVCGLCLANPPELKWLVKFRKAGLRRLHLFFINSTRKDVQSKDIKLLTWCCLNLHFFFCSRGAEEGCVCIKTNKINVCKNVLRIALYLMLPEKQDEVIKYTIRYITLSSKWNSEDYDFFVLQITIQLPKHAGCCIKIDTSFRTVQRIITCRSLNKRKFLQELITITTKPELLIAKIIKQAEISQREGEVREAFDISCSLANILERAYWDKYLFNHLLHNCLNTLLKLYLLSATNGSESPIAKIENVKFRIVIKSCIKYFITNIRDNKGVLDENRRRTMQIIQGLVSVLDSLAKCLHDPTIAEEDRIEIMEMTVFSAQKHYTESFRESITPDLLNLLLNSLLSNNKTVALISHKIFHHLLDRHKNEIHFSEPVYFFKGNYNLTVNYDCSIEDTHFVKSFSEKFLYGIHHCFLTFSEKFALITCYVTVCLLLVEVPEPVITINVIRALITTQNSVLKNYELNATVKFHIHAIIYAVLSLICVIHDDQVQPLRKYMEEVGWFRNENSPHLLPPLQNKYTFATHHTTEYHEQLYFIEEELLYALQRCWLSKRIQGSK